MYSEARGVGRDEAVAAPLYQKACDAGDALGCSGIGFSYEVGRGVVKDVARALTLYQKACDGGDTYGCEAVKRMKGA